jgi:hypothetical protein
MLNKIYESITTIQTLYEVSNIISNLCKNKWDFT